MDVVRRRVIMIHGFGTTTWSGAIMTGYSLNLAPIGQKPRFKIVLGNVRVKSVIGSHPLPHLLLCIGGVRKISGAGIHVRQSNDSI